MLAELSVKFILCISSSDSNIGGPDMPEGLWDDL